MSRFQQGSLLKMKRKGCPDVWVFRWYENATGTRTYKKRIVGSAAEMPTRKDAEKAVLSLRININAEIKTPERVCDLITHYRQRELTEERKAFATIENHLVLSRL